MEDTIRKILEVAVNAPSGHNYQPWKFRIQNNEVFLLYAQERDTTQPNSQQSIPIHGAVSHGALIENITIISRTHGYEAAVSLFPDQANSLLVASIRFAKSTPQEDPLLKYIPLRATNRKPYERIPLKVEHQLVLTKISQNKERGRILLLQDNEKKEIVAKAFAVNDELLLENRAAHQLLFPHILWNTKENREKKIGLFIDTLELPPPAKVIFRLLKYWPIAKILGKLGFGKVIAAQNQKIYASCSAIGLLSVPTDGPKDLIMGGRILQRFWLEATRMGLNIQPIAGLVYLAQGLLRENTGGFSPSQIERIKNAYKQINDTFESRDGIIVMTFRMGYATAPPSGSSLKLSPSIAT